MEKIKLVIWDLDETVWKGTLSEDGVVNPDDRIIDIIKKLNDRGIVNSICSKNDYEKAKSVLQELAIWDEFVFAAIDYMPKGEMIQGVLSNMSLRAANTLFVDDNVGNLEEAKYYNEGIRVLKPEQITEDILNQEEFSGYLGGRKKLYQYRMLEDKNQKRQQFTDNVSFLKQSNITIELIKYSEFHFKRLMELINKTNQLNFTKNRMSEDQVRMILSDPQYETVMCKVKDCFGDYGICGFYTLKNEMNEQRLVHFVFSCRILNMGIENYLYHYLSCPVVEIKGEIAGDLSQPKPDWISLIESSDEEYNPSSIDLVLDEKSKIHIFGIGACDLYRAISFFDNPNQHLVYECNEFKGKERGRNVGTEYIRSIYDMSESNKDYCKKHFYNYTGEGIFSSRIFDKQNDAVIMSFHDDMGYKIYTNKEDKNLRVVRSPDPGEGLTSIINHAGEIISHDEEERWLLENGFDDGKYISKKRFHDNVLWISDRVSRKTKIYLITGPELDFYRSYRKSFPEFREQILAINEVIRSLCAEYRNRFELIEINDVVRDRGDITNYVFHLTSEAGYRLYKMIAQRIIGTQGIIKPSMLQGIRKARRLCLIGEGIEGENAETTLNIGGEIVDERVGYEEFIDHQYIIDNNTLYICADKNHRKIIKEKMAASNKDGIDDYIDFYSNDQDSGREQEGDYIDSLIRNNTEIVNKCNAEAYTWDDCKKALRHKKMVVWGFGHGFWIALERLGSKSLAGVIDKDPCLDGLRMYQCFNEGMYDFGDMAIRQPETLKSYCADDTIIVIGSLRYYDEILEYIRLNFGDKFQCFSVLTMEINERTLGIPEMEKQCPSI